MSAATTKSAEVKKEFTLERFCVMWIQKSKNGNTYLSGRTEDGVFKLQGFFNKEKQNPKEPDIRVYTLDEKGERSEQPYVSLWVNATKNGKKVISGKVNGKKLVGFFNSKAEVGGKLPYINVYFQEDQPEEKKEEAKQEEIPSDLPF